MEEKLEKTVNSDEGRGRTGLSPPRPLRTLTSSLTKNTHKIKNLQKHYKTRKVQKKNKTHKIQKNLKKYKSKKHSKATKTQNTYVNILSTNASGLKNQLGDFKNKVKYFNSSIFTVQETHFPKKGRFHMDDYHIFEAIRKNKDKGGTMIGVHIDLKPVLVKEYSDQFELLVVEIVTKGTTMRLLSGYGPQESLDEKERSPFFEAVESEIVSAELQSKSVTICMDANSKLGPQYIEGDPHCQSKNGKLLGDLMDRHALCVINGLRGKCTGLITREKTKIDSTKRSVIDFVITSSDLLQHIESMHIER